MVVFSKNSYEFNRCLVKTFCSSIVERLKHYEDTVKINETLKKQRILSRPIYLSSVSQQFPFQNLIFVIFWRKRRILLPQHGIEVAVLYAVESIPLIEMLSSQTYSVWVMLSLNQAPVRMFKSMQLQNQVIPFRI